MNKEDEYYHIVMVLLLSIILIGVIMYLVGAIVRLLS